jgi:hypothetical protein
VFEVSESGTAADHQAYCGEKHRRPRMLPRFN